MQRHVEEGADSGVFETVTGTFKKIMFPGQSEIHSGLQLALINNPHWLAKRNAAYEGAVFFIKNRLVYKSSEERQNSYKRIIYLLDIAQKAHTKISANLSRTQNKIQVDYIGEYFNLLTNLIIAASSLINVDIFLNSKEENSINSFVGSKGSENLNIISVTCMEDEKKLHESVMNLIITVESLIEKEFSLSKKSLEKVDQVRYDEAFAELKGIYKKDIAYPTINRNGF